MTEKSSSSNNTPLIIAALIGALGGILAACIGLLPAILPMVRPSVTPQAFDTATFLPTSTETLIPETATASITPSEMPTLTATLEPLPTDTPVTETATVTVTAISASSDMQAYMGTWTNVEKNPRSDQVRLVLSRIEITPTGAETANFKVCREAGNDTVFVDPNPAPASIYLLGLGARDFIIPRYPDLRWAVIVQRTAEQLVATVQEYDLNNILLNSDTFNLEKASLLENLIPCQQP